MIFAHIKSAQDQEALDKALHDAKDKKWYRRLMIIALSAQRYTVAQLSELFSVCHSTVRRYIHAYNAEGLEGLRAGRSPGRPVKLAHWTKADWDEVLARSPNQYQKLNTESRQWTQELLVVYLREYEGIEVCLSTVYNSLRKTGRRTGRSKLRVGSPDPEYVVKRQVIEGMRSLPTRGN